MVSLVFFDILQLPHTVISNSEKFTHPTVHCTVLENCFFLFLGQNVTVTAGLEQFMTTFCQGYDIVHMQEYLCIFTNNV